MTAADLTPVRGNEKPSRTELSTLIGLMVKAPIDWHMPRPDMMEGYIKRSEELLHEMHVVMTFEAFQLEKLVQLPPGSPMRCLQHLHELTLHICDCRYLDDSNVERKACSGFCSRRQQPLHNCLAKTPPNAHNGARV